ncbi:MAG: glutathione reductase (NADPH) [Halieaceae bacterium]|jgi:glutathione reductase (NADPH)
MTEVDFDLFVIGAGSGGVRASRMAATRGMRVACAEERYLGGTCVNVGCVPKKLFVYASHYREDFHDARAYGWDSEISPIDWPRLRDNKTQEIERLNGIYDDLLAGAGVTVFDGRARITGPHSVSVNGETYSCTNILIATGGWPFVPDIPGAEHAITSNEVFFLEHLPKRALVVGGGYIAVEFAGILHGLGVDVTQFYRGPLFLRGFDQDCRQFLAQEMKKKGINLQFNSNVRELEKQADGSLLVHLDSGDSIETDLVMYATGRRALTDDLGLETVKVALRDNGSIVVDEFYRTSEASVFAIGDVKGGVELTPVALAEGMALVDTLCGPAPKTVDYEHIATAVFSQPNMGTVGLTEEQARERYAEVDIFRSEFRHLKHTLSGNTERTMMKLIVDKASDRVLGLHMVGADAGEIVQGMAIALKAGATKAIFDSTIGIHPTAAEEFVTMREPV